LRFSTRSLNQALLRRIGQPQNRLGVPTLTGYRHPRLHFPGQTEQNASSVDAARLRAHFSAICSWVSLNCVESCSLRPRFFNHEIFTLQVFDERDFEHFLVVRFAYNGGIVVKPASRAARQRRSPAISS